MASRIPLFPMLIKPISDAPSTLFIPDAFPDALCMASRIRGISYLMWPYSRRRLTDACSTRREYIFFAMQCPMHCAWRREYLFLPTSYRLRRKIDLFPTSFFRVCFDVRKTPISCSGRKRMS